MAYGKTDANHAELRDGYFRKLAKSVVDCSQFGMGFADLLVLTFDGQLYMVEIKDGAKCKSKRRLTPMQKEVALKFKERFLVAKNAEQAEWICIYPHLRDLLTGIKYMEETE